MTTLEEMKLLLREEDIPFFSDKELKFYLAKNNNDMNATLYECFNIKAENTTMNISGLSVADSSKYFRRLAAKYRPNNSGVLKS